MTTSHETTVQHTAANQRSRTTGAKVGGAVGKALGLAARLVKLVGAVLAMILVGHILLTVFEANPANSVTRLFAEYSSPLTLWFERLFIIDDPKLMLAVGYGLAAIFWLVVAAIVARLLRALRPKTGPRQI